MTSTQLKYIELEKRKEEYRRFLQELSDTINLLAKEIGTNGHFQDSEGIVYQLVESEGKFVHMDRYEVKHTRRPHERAGTLSLTKAKELGYNIE